MQIYFYLLLFFVAFAANLLSALAGGGAGLVQLPILILLGLPFPIALATHKVASVSLGVGASIRYFQKKALNPFLSLFILLCGLPGVLIGANAAILLPGEFSTIALGFLTLCLGLYSKTNKEFGINVYSFNPSFINYFFGGTVLFLIGLINGSLSSGTGLFVTIWLIRWFGLTYTKAIAHTLILVGFFWNGTGAFALAFTSTIKWSWLPSLICGSILGGYIGAYFSLLKGNSFVKVIFEITSIFIGIFLIFRGIY